MRALFAAGLLGWLGSLLPAISFADSAVKIRALTPTDPAAPAEAIVSGQLDDQFKAMKDIAAPPCREAHHGGEERDADK